MVAIATNGSLEVIKCCIEFFQLKIKQPALMPCRCVVLVEAYGFVQWAFSAFRSLKGKVTGAEFCQGMVVVG